MKDKEFKLNELVFICGKARAQYGLPVIHRDNVKQFIKEILEEIKLECKTYDMTYGEVGNNKLSFEEIKQIIIQKSGFEGVELMERIKKRAGDKLITK